MFVLKIPNPFIPQCYFYGFQSIRFTRAFLGLYIYIPFLLKPYFNICKYKLRKFETYTLRSLKKISAKIKNITALSSKNDMSPVTCLFAANVVYCTPVSLVAVFTYLQGQAYPACPFFCLSESK